MVATALPPLQRLPWAVPIFVHDGARLAYDDLGAGPRVVLLAHNLFTHRGTFRAVAERLARRARVLSVDLRGHGESGGTRGPFSTPELAGDLAALLDALAIPRALLVGTSLGAAAALGLALARPARAEGLVLLAANPRPPGLRERLTFETLAVLLRVLGPAPVLPAILAGLHAPGAPPALLEASALQLRAMSRQDLAQVARAWIRRPAQLGRLGGLDLPARVVVGSADTSCPRAAGEALAAELRAPLVEIASAGHTIQAERPDEVAALVEAMLDAS